MCGRFALFSTSDIIKHLFGLKVAPTIAPRYNIAPTEPVLIVRRGDDARATGRQAAMVRWGFIPPWAKETRTLPLMINAKAETVFESPAFRDAATGRRCLVPADGFYEWRTLVGGRKQPLFIRHKEDGPMAFAGLWSRWHGTVEGEEAVVESCVILTTDANDTVASVHDRMPVIVPPAAWDVWLDTSRSPDDVDRLLTPAGAEVLEMWPVSQKVNKPGVDGAELIRKEGQQALF